MAKKRPAATPAKAAGRRKKTLAKPAIKGAKKPAASAKAKQLGARGPAKVAKAAKADKVAKTKQKTPRGVVLALSKEIDFSKPFKKVLYVLRGPPGCGKSTVARLLLQRHLQVQGVRWNGSSAGAAISTVCRAFICSTDDYFTELDEEGGASYDFDPSCLREFHEKNRKRCLDAMEPLGSTLEIPVTTLERMIHRYEKLPDDLQGRLCCATELSIVRDARAVPRYRYAGLDVETSALEALSDLDLGPFFWEGTDLSSSSARHLAAARASGLWRLPERLHVTVLYFGKESKRPEAEKLVGMTFPVKVTGLVFVRGGGLLCATCAFEAEDHSSLAAVAGEDWCPHITLLFSGAWRPKNSNDLLKALQALAILPSSSPKIASEVEETQLDPASPEGPDDEARADESGDVTTPTVLRNEDCPGYPSCPAGACACNGHAQVAPTLTCPSPQSSGLIMQQMEMLQKSLVCIRRDSAELCRKKVSGSKEEHADAVVGLRSVAPPVKAPPVAPSVVPPVKTPPVAPPGWEPATAQGQAVKPRSRSRDSSAKKRRSIHLVEVEVEWRCAATSAGENATEVIAATFADWNCPNCGVSVFASKSECFKCHTKKDGTKGTGLGDCGPPPQKFSEALWEKPRQQTGLQLVGELQPTAGWRYVLSDESRRCFAAYLSSPFTADQTRQYFNAIKEGTDWKQPEADNWPRSALGCASDADVGIGSPRAANAAKGLGRWRLLAMGGRIFGPGLADEAWPQEQPGAPAAGPNGHVFQAVKDLYEATEWSKRWVWPFDLYAPVFEAARQNGSPLVALNPATEVRRRLPLEGLRALTQEDRGLRLGRPWTIDVILVEVEDEQFFAEEAPTSGYNSGYLPDAVGFAATLREPAFRSYADLVVMPSYDTHVAGEWLGSRDETVATPQNFLSARVFRDEAMAYAAWRYLNKDQRRGMLLIVGCDHVRYDFGIPARLKRLGSGSTRWQAERPLLLHSAKSATSAVQGQLAAGEVFQAEADGEALKLQEMTWDTGAFPCSLVEGRKLKITTVLLNPTAQEGLATGGRPQWYLPAENTQGPALADYIWAEA
eukprot:g16356.t1